MLGILLLLAGFGTLQRRRYGYRFGLMAIFVAGLWSAAAITELILTRSDVLLARVLVVFSIVVSLAVSFLFACLWKNRRPWFKG